MGCSCNNVPDTPSGGSPNCCPTAFCSDLLLNLPESRRMQLVGIASGSRCLNVFPRKQPGFYVQDGKYGGFITIQPQVPIPYLKTYLVDQNGDPIYTPSGDKAEDLPPGIESLIGAGDCGLQWRITGQGGKRQKIIWDGCKYIHVNDDDVVEAQDLDSVYDGRQDCEMYPTVWIRNSDGTLKLGYMQNSYRIPGEIIAFGGPRSGLRGDFLACDGDDYDPEEYPDLFAAIGYRWGRNGDLFKVPDLRGSFLRGVDHGAGRDPSSSSRTATSTGGAVGDNVGSYQDDAFQCHEHSVPFQTGVAGSSESIDTNSNQTNGPAGLVKTNGVYESECGDPRTDDETRPKNSYVEFAIYSGCKV